MKTNFNSLKKIFTVTVLLFIANQLSAQPFVDLLNVKAQYFPGSAYVTDASSKLSVMQYEASFMLPMVQKNKDVILFGGDYTQLNFNSSGKTTEHKYLYSTSLSIGYEKHWKKEKWKTLLLTLPKINSDEISFGKKNFQMGGILLFNYKKNESLKYHFGAYYNKECFGNFFMPLLGIDWRVNDKLNVWGDMPANFNLEYKMGKTLYAGASYLSITGSYCLQSQAGNMYVRDGDKSFGHNELKAFVNCYITKHLVWFAEGGHTFGRMYQLYNNSNELQSSSNVYQRNLDGWFANTGIAFRFRTEEK
ncbi:MAG: DUF6268 family outer membrane beta-barrel protein [Bacteroidota bacterium]